MTYNIWNAAAYEICLIFIDFKPAWKLHPLIKRVMYHCFLDWVAWKTERTMKNVDKQIKDLHKQWDEEEAKENQPIITHHESDGSKAQELLGGTLQITAPWYHRQQNESKPEG